MSAFDPIKTTQAAGLLISLHGGNITRLRLLKLLYIADRECLAETLRPITWDSAVAMDNGPVLSNTYDLIKGTGPSGGDWDRHIRALGSRCMTLVSDADVDRLSRHEMNKLRDVAKRFDELDDYELADYTHDFQEWIQNKPDKGTCNPISFDDRLAGAGLGDDEKQRIIRDRTEDIAFAQMIQEVRA